MRVGTLEIKVDSEGLYIMQTRAEDDTMGGITVNSAEEARVLAKQLSLRFGFKVSFPKEAP